MPFSGGGGADVAKDADEDAAKDADADTLRDGITRRPVTGSGFSITVPKAEKADCVRRDGVIGRFCFCPFCPFCRGRGRGRSGGGGGIFVVGVGMGLNGMVDGCG